MATTAQLTASAAQFIDAADKASQIVNGPATGPTSLVPTTSGDLPTFARSQKTVDDFLLSKAAVYKIAFFGDSRTNGCAGGAAGLNGSLRYLNRSYIGWGAARLNHAFMPVRNPYTGSGTALGNLHYGWDGARIEHLLYSTVNEISALGNKWPGVTKTPLRCAIEAMPDAFMNLIGINNINPTCDVPTIILYLRELLTAQYQTGAKIFIGEEIPYINTTTDPDQIMLDKIVEYNSFLPQLAIDFDATIIPWHASMLTGLEMFYTDEDAGAGTIRLHPNTAGQMEMGRIFADTIAPFVRKPFMLPSLASPGWVTQYPYPITNTAGVGTGLTNSGAGTPSIYTDSNGTKWQQWTLTGAGSVWAYLPAFSTGAAAALVTSQQPIRVGLQYEIVSGTCTGMCLQGQITDAAYAQKCSGGQSIDSNNDGVFLTDNRHPGMLLSQEFPLPAGSVYNLHQILAHFSGPAVFRMTAYGCFKSQFPIT